MLRSFGIALVDIPGVGILVGTVAVIAALLALLALPDVAKRPLIIASVTVGVLGLIALAYRMRIVYKKSIAQGMLTEFLLSGRTLLISALAIDAERNKELQAWCGDVEYVLKNYLSESYVMRFRVHGLGRSTTPAIYEMWEIQERVKKIEEFLSELER